jgi:hypothetical protein
MQAIAATATPESSQEKTHKEPSRAALKELSTARDRKPGL